MDFEPVELESPRGNKHVARSPRELNELTAGHGYKIVHKHEMKVVPAPVKVTPAPWVTPPPVESIED